MTESDYVNTPSSFELLFAKDGISLETTAEKITATFAFVQNDDREILVMKNERGWDIPGGHLDENEDVLDATHREVLEEACVTIKNVGFFALIKNADTAMSVFRAEPVEEKEFVQNIEDPTSDRTWMSADQFMKVYSGGDKVMMSGLLAELPAN